MRGLDSDEELLDMARLKAAINEGVDINAPIDEYDQSMGITPVTVAVQVARGDILAVLLAAGAKVGPYDIMMALRGHESRMNCLSALLDSGIDVPSEVETEFSTIHCALEFLRGKDRVNAVKALLAAGADPSVDVCVVGAPKNPKNRENGRTPLDIAMDESDIEVVEILLDAGAKMKAHEDNSIYVPNVGYMDRDEYNSAMEMLDRFGLHHSGGADTDADKSGKLN